MSSHTDFSTLNRIQIVRILMRLLWQTYDTGGISCRRSLRAGLLESIMDLFPVFEGMNQLIENGLEEWVFDDAAKKLCLEKTDVHDQPFLSLSLDIISNECLASLAVSGILDVHKDFEKRNEDFNLRHRRLAEKIFLYLGGEKYLSLFEAAGISYAPMAIIEEGDDRTTLLNRKECAYLLSGP